MPLLPQPSTTSPGALQLLYLVGAIDHVAASNLVADVDITDIATLRSAAQSLADIIKAEVSNITSINSWRLLDPSGVSLYEEAFDSPRVGTRTPTSDEVSMQSASITLTGKGRPPVGLAQGQTRFVWFPGFFDVVNWPNARAALTAGDIDLTDLRTHLNESDVIGADHYGVKADWRNYFVPQVNAHFQKKYGI